MIERPLHLVPHARSAAALEQLRAELDDAEKALAGAVATAGERLAANTAAWARWRAWQAFQEAQEILPAGTPVPEKPPTPAQSDNEVMAEGGRLRDEALRRKVEAEQRYLGAHRLARELGLLEDVDASRAEEQRILGAVLTWLRVRTEAGYPWPEDADRLGIELDHAARGGLLGWLLDGNEPLPVPPPLAMSRPCHALLRDGKGTPYEVWEPQGGMQEVNLAHYGVETVVVEQHPWRVLERVSPTEWVVQPFQGRTTRLGHGRWRARATGPRLWQGKPVADSGHSNDLLWEIVREDARAGFDGETVNHLVLTVADAAPADHPLVPIGDAARADAAFGRELRVYPTPEPPVRRVTLVARSEDVTQWHMGGTGGFEVMLTPAHVGEEGWGYEASFRQLMQWATVQNAVLVLEAGGSRQRVRLLSVGPRAPDEPTFKLRVYGVGDLERVPDEEQADGA